MAILVAGAGAIGTVLAAALAAGGNDVTLLARGHRLAQLRAFGCAARIGGTELRPPVTVTDSPKGAFDLVIVATKQCDLASIALPVANALTDQTRVLFAMNGLPWWFADGVPGAAQSIRGLLDPDARLARIFDARETGVIIVQFGSSIGADGTAVCNAGARMEIGWRSPAHGPLPQFAAAMAVDQVADLRSAIFGKLIANAAYAPLTAITGLTNQALHAVPALANIQHAVVRDLLALGARLGLALAPSPDLLLAKGAALGPGFKSSMLEDLERGRRPELDAIVFAPCLLGQALGCPQPHLETLGHLASWRFGQPGGLHPPSPGVPEK